MCSSVCDCLIISKSFPFSVLRAGKKSFGLSLAFVCSQLDEKLIFVVLEIVPGSSKE